MASNKMSSVPSWYQQTADKKPLKKHRIGPPDVYPLDTKTEEENLSTNRILKGWHQPGTVYEHESLVYHGREAKLSKIDECLYRSSVLICGAFSKKCDVNATLDKDRKKQGKEALAAQNAQLQAGNTKSKERASFFTDLARGKPFTQLARKIPIFSKKREEMLDYLCDYKIPTFRALWFLKISATYYAAMSTKKKPPDSLAGDYKTMFHNEITDLMRKMWATNDLTASNTYKDRWHYITSLARRAFDDGVIEKQEFLNDMCEVFCDFYLPGHSTVKDMRAYQNHGEKSALLRVFLIMFSQYIKYINLNMILARRTAHMFAMKLRMMLMEYEERYPGEPFYQEVQHEVEDKEPTTIIINTYHKLAHCKSHRANIYLMSAMLHTICIDAPAAVIWNNFKVAADRMPFIISQLCCSPLDLLPCPIYDLPVPPGKESEKFKDLLKLRHMEITRRSLAVQDKWSFNLKEQKTYAQKIERCLDVIGTLDSANVFDPHYIPSLAATLFNIKPSENYNMETLLRLRLIFQWSVTIEREGAYRQRVIAKLIKHQIGYQKHPYFGGLHIQDAIMDFFCTEAPQPGEKNYGPEFGAMMTLFLEMMRERLFEHDWFVKFMIRNDEHDYSSPVLPRYLAAQSQLNGTMTSSGSEPDSNGTMENGVPAPPPPSAEPVERPPPTPAGVIIPPVEKSDEHILTTEDMWFKHRILIQVPLPQTEEYRNEANQREMVVHGTGEAAENHKTELKKIAKEICKIWQKKIYIKFIRFKDGTERLWCPKRYTAQRVQETLSKFRTQTYYDQVVICGWCSESFVDMIHDFITGKSLQMPTSDGLDILLGMLEESKYIFGVFEICEAILPMLPLVEKVVRSLAADVIPGTIACQIGYVFVSFLGKHWHYFLHSGRAPTICNQLYNLIERMIRAQDYPANSWGRVIAAFVYHAKKQLKKANLTDSMKIHGAHDEFRNVFNHGCSSTSGNVKYNSIFFADILEGTSQELRYYSYHMYKKRLPSFGIVSNRYSFIINSFIAAKNCGRDFDRLTNLSAFCGHISAQIPALADEWITAIRCICLRGPNYPELVQQLDMTDCSIHYPLATFVMLLAGKYAFSVPRLIFDILTHVFSVMSTHEKNYYEVSAHDREPGVCLALYILAQICCASDQPFILTPHYLGTDERTKLVRSTADENVLSMIHWCEMDNALFSLLCNVGFLQNSLKGRHKELDIVLPVDVTSTIYRKEYLTNIVRATLSSICEQDWVTMKMFDIVQSNNMEAFNNERLKQNGLGQQLLRMSIRRRSEKAILKELTVCNGNSKKALIDKLLSSMNLWNMRATLFDLMLMIKEISPETNRYHQQGAIQADALYSEIGRCCRDLFTTAYKERTKLPNAILDDSFRISHISNYWLIAPLIRMCPRPNLPTNCNVSVAGKFLIEASRLLDIANDSSRERIHQSTWLLSQQSFLNLILVSLKIEKNQGKGAKEQLVLSLYKQIQDIVLKTKGNPALPHMEKFSMEKEGLLLRLSLVGGIFEQICRSEACDMWAYLLFQVMLHGIVSPDKDKIMFDSCYDMLSTLMLWTLIDPQNQQTLDGDNGEPKYRWPHYAHIIKKLRREVPETRIPGDLRHLYQFLPIPKNTADLIGLEPCGIPQHLIPAKGKSKNPTLHLLHGMRHGRIALQPVEKHKVNTYDFIHGYVPEAISSSNSGVSSGNIKIGWKWSYFQAVKMDKYPIIVQKFIAKMAQHKHPSDPCRPPLALTDSGQDHFLTPPAVEPTEVTTPPASSASTSGTTTSTATSPTTTTAPTNGAATTPTSSVDSPASVEVATPPSRPDSRPETKEEPAEESEDEKPQIVDTPPQTTSTVTTPTSNPPPVAIAPTLPPVVPIPANTITIPDPLAVNTPEAIRPPSSGNASTSESPKRSRKRPAQGLTRQPSQTKQRRSNSRAENPPPQPAPGYGPGQWPNPNAAPNPAMPTSSQPAQSYPPMPPHPAHPPMMQSNPPAASNPPPTMNAPPTKSGAEAKATVHDFVQKRMELKEQQLTATGMAGNPNAPPPHHAMPPAPQNDFGRNSSMPGGPEMSQPALTFPSSQLQQQQPPQQTTNMMRPSNMPPPQTNMVPPQTAMSSQGAMSQGNMPPQGTMSSQGNAPPQGHMPPQGSMPSQGGMSSQQQAQQQNMPQNQPGPQHQPPHMMNQAPSQSQMQPPHQQSMQSQQQQQQPLGQQHPMQSQHQQQQMPSQQHQHGMQSQHQQPMHGQHQPSMSGQHQPPMPSQHQPSMSNQHQPPMANQHHQGMQNPHQQGMSSQQQHQPPQMSSQQQHAMQNQHPQQQPPMHQQHHSSMPSHQQPPQQQQNSMMSGGNPQNGTNFGMGMQPRNQMGQFSSVKEEPRQMQGMSNNHMQQHLSSQQQPQMGMPPRGQPDMKPQIMSQGPGQMGGPSQGMSAMTGSGYGGPPQNQQPPMGGPPPMNPPMQQQMRNPQQMQHPQMQQPSQQMPSQSSMPQNMQPQKPPGMSQPGPMGGQPHGMSMPPTSAYGQQHGMSSQSQGMPGQPPMQRPPMSQQSAMGGSSHMPVTSHGMQPSQQTSSGYPHHPQQSHGGMTGGPPQSHMPMQSSMSSMQHGMGAGSQMPSHMSSMGNVPHQNQSYMGGQDTKHMGQPPMGSGPSMQSSQGMMTKPMMGAPPQQMAPSYGGPSAPSYSHGKPGYQTGGPPMGGQQQGYGGPMGQSSYSSGMSHVGPGGQMASRMGGSGMMGGQNMGGPPMSGPNMGGPPISGGGMGMNPQYGQQQYMMNDQRMMPQQQQQQQQPPYGHQNHHYNQPPQY